MEINNTVVKEAEEGIFVNFLEISIIKKRYITKTFTKIYILLYITIYSSM